MTEITLGTHLWRLGRIAIYSVGLLALTGAIPLAAAGLLNLLLPKTLVPLLIFIASVIVVIAISVFCMGFFWVALENVVEEYWKERWERWQQTINK